MATYTRTFATVQDTLPWLEVLTRIKGCTVRVTRRPSQGWGKGRKPPLWEVRFTHDKLQGRARLHQEGLYLSADQCVIRYTPTGRRQLPEWERLLKFDGTVEDLTSSNTRAA